MARLFKFSLAGLLLVFSLPFIASAENMDDYMVKIYGGLADIVERNINSPERCVIETEGFIKKNQALIDKMHQTIKQNIQRAQSREYSEEEVQAMQQGYQGMAASKGSQQMNRFVQAIQNFSANNPDFEEKLGDAMVQLQSQGMGF